MTSADPRTWFPAFYENPAIRALANASRWTISGQIGDSELDESGKPQTRKAPIDIRHLLNGCNPGCRHQGPVRGAWSTDQLCLVNLDELTTAVPSAANAAFYLQAQTDGLLVLDIEPDCPPEIAEDLLRLPGIHYSELSMSGKGYHLVMSLPTNFHEFPIAAGKRVLRHEHGWFELLLDHWTTFTRQPVPDSTTARVTTMTTPSTFSSIEEVYASLARNARESASSHATAVNTEGDMPDIAYSELIIEQTIAFARERIRGPEEFNHDLSRQEFSALGVLYRWLITAMAPFQLGETYSATDTTWLLYAAAREVIPNRPKHNQVRNGRPYLLDRAASLVADRIATRERELSQKG